VYVTYEHVRHNKSGIAHQGCNQVHSPLCSLERPRQQLPADALNPKLAIHVNMTFPEAAASHLLACRAAASLCTAASAAAAAALAAAVVKVFGAEPACVLCEFCRAPSHPQYVCGL